MQVEDDDFPRRNISWEPANWKRHRDLTDDPPKPIYYQAYFSAELPPDGLPARFAILTAFNPFGRQKSEEANLRLDAALEQELIRAKSKYFRATGGSQDGAHREPGFGILTDSPESIRFISRQFRQDAFFWISEGIVYIQNTDGKNLHRVDTWAARQMW